MTLFHLSSSAPFTTSDGMSTSDPNLAFLHVSLKFFESVLAHVGLLQPPLPRPNELLLHVASFLPISSASSFSLCSQTVYLVVGEVLRDLRQMGAADAQNPDFFNFLLLLERDMSRHSACYHCRRLHRIKKAHKHLHYNSKIWVPSYLPCWKADHDSLTHVFIHKGFSSTVFRMTMRMHSQGHDHSELLRLLSLKTDIVRFRSKQVEQETAHAKIVAGSLLFRH